MTGYLAIGLGLAVTRLFLEKLGVVRDEQRESVWVMAVAMTDILWWPLVLTVLMLQRSAAGQRS